MPPSKDLVTNQSELEMTVRLDGSVNVSVTIVAVNNIGERSDAVTAHHLTNSIRE